MTLGGTTTTTDGSSTTTWEASLARHPEFGDAEVITAKAAAFYRFAIDLLAERSAEVRDLADGLRGGDGDVPRSVVDDPLVRVTLDEGIARLEKGELDESAGSEVVTMLRLVATALAEHGVGAPPTGSEVATGGVAVAPDREAWLCGPRATGDLGRTFLGAFDRDFLRGVPGDLVTADASAVQEFDAGFAALAALLPELAASVGAHYVGVGRVDVRTEGETFLAGNVGRIPGVVFFSPNRMSRPWRFAETALHEGLHLKLFDIQRSMNVFEAPERLADGPTVNVPWLKWASMVAPNEWALDRALGAFHVYAHLVVFARALRERLTPEILDRFGPPEDVDTPSLYRNGPERALYLGEEILRLGEHQLTDQGRELVTWLLDTAKEVGNA